MTPAPSLCVPSCVDPSVWGLMVRWTTYGHRLFSSSKLSGGGAVVRKGMKGGTGKTSRGHEVLVVYTISEQPAKAPVMVSIWLSRWQHLTGDVNASACWLCGEEEEPLKHLWLRCPAHILERHCHHLSGLVNHSDARLSPQGIMLRRLGWIAS